MQKFLSDLPGIVRLKFRPVEYYRYSAAVTAAALLILGIVNAGMASAYLGASAGVTVAYMTLICVARWVSLTVTMQFFLPVMGAPKMQLGGFILLSEFLAVPLILSVYSPLLMFAAMFWQLWAFLGTVARFTRIFAGGLSAADCGLSAVLSAFGGADDSYHPDFYCQPVD